MRNINETIDRMAALCREIESGNEESQKELNILCWMVESSPEFARAAISRIGTGGGDAEPEAGDAGCSDDGKLDELKDALDKAKSLLAEADSENSRLKEENRKLDAKVSDLQDIFKKASDKAGAANAEILKNTEIIKNKHEKLALKYDEAKEKISALSAERDNLKCRVQSLEASIREKQKQTGTEKVILIKGTEEDMYLNEQMEIIIDILKKEVPNYEKGTRRRDILESVIKANPASGMPEKMSEKVKKALRDYAKLDAGTRQELTDAGISIEMGSKHYKLTYHDDPRYVTALSATPSDTRNGGRNAAKAIIKTMF